MIKSLTMVNFPVLRQLRVDDYQMFPGKNGKGINHSLCSGVTIIAGINGLGKTTLLNAIFRVLAGPYDWQIEGDADFGGMPHRLRSWRNSSYFRTRVGNEADEATISAVVSFDTERLTVTRSLQDLRIIALKLNDDDLDTSQNAYEEIIKKLSNTTDIFDFYIILRLLIFFLEDRKALVWDGNAQFDIFRVLFFDKKSAAELANLFDNIQRKDSDRRNKRVHHRRNENRLRNLLSAADQAPETRVRVNDLQSALEAAEERENDLAREITMLLEELAPLRLKLERAKLDLEEKRREYQGEQQKFFGRLFPTIDKVAEYVFVNLAGGGGCLVCGNTAASAADRLQEFVEKQRCPICGSSPDQQEKIVPEGAVSERRLQKLDARVRGLGEDIASLDEALRYVVYRDERVIKEYHNPQGRADLWIQQGILGSDTGSCIIELKVLRSRYWSVGKVTPSTCSERKNRQNAIDGIEQAADYRDHVDAGLAFLCCFDARDEDEEFSGVKKAAGMREVIYKRYYMYSSVTAARQAHRAAKNKGKLLSGQA